MVPFDIQRRYPCFEGLTRNAVNHSIIPNKEEVQMNPSRLIFSCLSNKLPDGKKFSQHFCLNNHSNLFRVLFIRSEMPSDSKYYVSIFEQDAGSTCILEEI